MTKPRGRKPAGPTVWEVSTIGEAKDIRRKLEHLPGTHSLVMFAVGTWFEDRAKGTAVELEDPAPIHDMRTARIYADVSGHGMTWLRRPDMDTLLPDHKQPRIRISAIVEGNFEV